MDELDLVVRLGIAALAGLAVGVEREWSGHATGPHARFAGVRTFFLLGASSGIAGWLLEIGEPLPAVAILIAAGALIVAAYVLAASRSVEAIDGTTEAAAILVLGMGLLAGAGHLRVASGLAAVVVLALGEKDTIRHFIGRIGQTEMRAALQFAVLALVILPLLPTGPFGPYDSIRPRALWIVVLLFSGLNFIGYLARKTIGGAKGYPVIGALGGLVSSTAVTFSFSRQSRKEPDSSAPLAIGTVAACTILIPRILVATLILNPRLAPSAALGLAPIFAAGVVLLLLAWRSLRESARSADVAPPRNPLQLKSAIQMAVAFQVVLLLLGFANGQFGQTGVLASAALLGLTDMDALTFGMNRLAEDPNLVLLAAQAITLGVIINSLFKAVLALVLGSSRYRLMTMLALLAQAAAGGGGFWLLGWLAAK
jgi:uncharacterized membrane protein (DUF4010 family)